jgi:predicted RNase H-like nuclease (RuvC/YqgF family)
MLENDTEALREEIARQKGVIDRLHGVLSRMSQRNDQELAKKDELISQLQGTVDHLRKFLDDDRGQM